MGAALPVYGIAVEGLGAGAEDPVPEGWPVWTVRQVAEPWSGEEGMSIWPGRAWIGVTDTGDFRLEREPRIVRFSAPEPWTEEALLHPGLSPVAAVVAHWMDRAALHCAAVLAGGCAWGLLGERGAGKSTTAALLAALGHGVLTDDLLVVDGLTAYAGPRSIDLRADASGRLGGVALGRLGARERWRKPVAPRPLTAPLGGWVELAWSAEAGCSELGAAERVEVLSRHAGLPLPGPRLLELADRPMLRFARRQDLAGAEAAARVLSDRLLEAL